MQEIGSNLDLFWMSNALKNLHDPLSECSQLRARRPSFLCRCYPLRSPPLSPIRGLCEKVEEKPHLRKRSLVATRLTVLEVRPPEHGSRYQSLRHRVSMLDARDHSGSAGLLGAVFP